MRIGPAGEQHLTYCLNVHAGESWYENVDAVRRYARAVRDRLSVDGPFGLGLRVSAAAAHTLAEPDELEAFRSLLADQNLYVFTINGFPYGTFHAAPVKEEVYAPDWRQPERVDYTLRLARILASLLPKGVSGSISTAPGSYKAWVQTEDDRRQVAENLLSVAVSLAGIADDTGREIHLGLEPEPDCMLETTPEAIAFFTEDLAKAATATDALDEEGLRRHLGVCFDACHMALQFENLAESVRALTAAGVRISKVQLSAALRARESDAVRGKLGAFADSVYLHQTRIRTLSGRILRFFDLPPALDVDHGPDDPPDEWRTHCHVPLYWEGDDPVASTADLMDDAFFTAVAESGCAHLELETYTFDVLPAPLRERGVVASVVDEYRWLLGRIDR